MIRARDLSVVRRGPGRPPVRALRGVCVGVGPGEVLAVLGPTGSGKTTLIEALAGLCPISGGRVEIGPEGQGVSWGPGGVPPAGVRQGIGTLFQMPERQLFGATALEDVSWGLGPGGRERAQGALARVGLGRELWDVPLALLSRGERRRVALAVALVREPRVLLLDEPLAGLDPDGQGLLWEELRVFLVRERGAVVLTSHWPEEVLPRAHRVLCLDRGEVRFDGTPGEFLQAARHRPGLARLLPRGWVPEAGDQTTDAR